MYNHALDGKLEPDFRNKKMNDRRMKFSLVIAVCMVDKLIGKEF